MIINPYRFAAAGGFEDFGNASRAFNGTSDYLITTASSVDAFNYIHEDKVFTIAAWIKLDDHTAEGIQVITANSQISSLDKGFTAWYDNRTGVREKGFVLYISHGTSGQVDFLAQANVISDNNWHHVCWTGDGSDITFYLDGVADVTTEPVTYTGVYGSALRSLHVGQISSANYFDGKIADLRIYDEDIETTAAGSVANLSNGIDVATGLQHWIIKDADSVEDYALGDNPAGFYYMRTDTGTTYDTNGPAD
jgi:hypothetical protein